MRKSSTICKTEEAELKRQAIAAFKEHWTDALRWARRGKSLGKKLAECFEGNTESHQRILARLFFGIRHARKMCKMTNRQIGQKLSCYLPRAVEYAIGEYREPLERRKFIRDLVSGVYVLFDSSQCSGPENYDEHWKGLDVAKYPGDCLYDDWYERTVGSSFFSCGTFLLMKSTGEHFGGLEMRWLEKAIQNNIDSNAPAELYGFEFEPLAANRIWIKIYTLERDVYPNLYLEGVMEQVKRLDARRLSLFLEKMIACLASKKEFVQHDENKPVSKKITETLMRRLIGDPSKLSREKVFEKVERVLGGKKTSDEALREVENVLNYMLKQEVRDYHTGVNW